MVFRGNDCRYARAVGHAQTSTQVAWIGDSVEQQQAARGVTLLEQFLDRERRQAGFDQGHHTLMAATRAQAIESPGIDGMEFQPGLFGRAPEIAHPGIDP